jgi:hypothetical protein
MEISIGRSTTMRALAYFHKKQHSFAAFLAMLLFVMLAFTGSSYANGNENAIDRLAETLTTARPGTDAFERAVTELQGLSAENQDQVASAIIEKVTGNAQRAVNLLSVLNMFNKNPVGKRLSGTLRRNFEGLMDVLRDPFTAGGKNLIARQLERFDFSGEEAVDLIFQLEERLKREKREAEEKERATSRSESVHFNANTETLFFRDDIIVDVNVGSGINDPIIGASVHLPDFTFDGIDPEGDFVFSPIENEQFEIREGPNVFLRGKIPVLLFIEGEFWAAILDPILSGVEPDSPLFGGLPPLGSSFVASVAQSLSEEPFTSYLLFTFLPDIDFLDATDMFTQTASSPGTNGIAVVSNQVPEPGTLMLVGVGLAGMIFVFAVRRMRRRSV